MRKILFSIIIVLLAVGTYFLLVEGLSIGNLHVYSISGIQELGDSLNNKIDQATELTTVTYKSENQSLNDALESLQSKREEYENKLATSNQEEIEKAETTKKLEIQYVWAIIGNYATSNGLKLTLNLKNTSTGLTGQKDLDFILEGTYNGIKNFLYNLEDDENLGFKIEDFSLVPIVQASNNGDSGSTATILQAKFSVKGINVELS